MPPDERYAQCRTTMALAPSFFQRMPERFILVDELEVNGFSMRIDDDPVIFYFGLNARYGF
jgi:hypothetical protein